MDLDALEMQCKAYMRDIKSMDKEMRSWDNFLWLQETIKNILVALRAIHQLRNPAIKDRHWTQLSSATQVKKQSVKWINFSAQILLDILYLALLKNSKRDLKR